MTPFVVALENEEFDLRPLTVLSKLTGSRQFRMLPVQIGQSAKTEWNALLEEWDYLGAETVLENYGAYLEQSWAADLSGVLVAHESGTRIQWLPNPFARPPIRDPRLLKIGFPLDKLGFSQWKSSQ